MNRGRNRHVRLMAEGGIGWQWVAIAALACLLFAAEAYSAVPVFGAQTRPSSSARAAAASRAGTPQITNADRKAAASRAQVARAGGLSATLSALLHGRNPLSALSPTGKVGTTAILTPGAAPDYFGTTPNYANSPLPEVDASGNVVPGTGIRKFVDSLPGLGEGAANNLGQHIPVANPDRSTYPGADYYIIGLREYSEKLGSDIPTTTLRGYYQINDGTTGPTDHSSNYLGPTIIAQRNRAVRVKFVNQLPTGTGGDLFLPVDKTLMGAGDGPNGGSYTQNRATLHLHGGATPWISDGTPHQWTTPAGESTTYTAGVSVHNVPDMDGGNEPNGTLTFYYTNQQSARLMFYHDHSYGITRLNVYAGEAAPYLLQDSVEEKLVNGGDIQANGATVTVAAGTIPADQIPLVIQDRTFVPNDSQLASEDPTWDKAKWGGLGNLWFPHVYMPNQNPADPSGVNALGRWDYSFWMYPPLQGVANGPVANPLSGNTPMEGALNPGTPTPSAVPEAFMDTPLVNGTAYPYVKVGRKAYRFRILNASNDRNLNLQIYFAKSNTPAAVDSSGNPTLQTTSGEVPMTPAIPHPGDPNWPATWPTDGRDGGVPDPSAAGPSMIQIGNEGGFLPSATVLPNTPVGFEYFRRTILFANVTNKTLFLGPAERADVIVDFSQVPAGSRLIMYNDAPAAVPGFDSRYDYYTGDPDQVVIGGAPTTRAGYGPNTRTVMQFDVEGATAAAPFDISSLETGLRAAYAASQDRPIVPESAYGSVYATTYPDVLPSVLSTTLTFQPFDSTSTVTLPLNDKAILEGFDMDYGRMNAQLGEGLPNTGFGAGAAVNYAYPDPPTEEIANTPPGTQIGTTSDGTQIWRIEHQGVDTHAIHFHLFNVQVIARVAIDGQVLPPDPNELGWKETVRMNPGTETILALRPIAMDLPWKLPDSIRPLNPIMPIGATFLSADGVPVVNKLTDFGWEYVWHCHLLGHEENDMMRPLVFRVAPPRPVTLRARPLSGPTRVTLSWSNPAGSPGATNYFIQRATDPAFTTGLTSTNITGTPSAYADTSVAPLVRYYYRVRAENLKGYSDWSDTVSVLTNPLPPFARSRLKVGTTTRTTLLVRWSNPGGGYAASQLAVQYSRSSRGPWKTAVSTLRPSTTSYTIRHLRTNARYWIRILAINDGGTTATAVFTGRTKR